MGGAYDGKLRFPARFLTDDLVEAIDHDTGLNTLEDILEYGLPDTTPTNERMVEIEVQEFNGVFDKTEAYLEQNQMPFDRWCSAGDGNPPDVRYFRPDQNIDLTLIVAPDETELISVDVLKDLFDDHQRMTKHQIHEKIEHIKESYTSRNVTPIEHLIPQTEIGRNRDKMTRINEVLSQLDAGTLSQEEAMQKIKDITEEATPDATTTQSPTP